jgi:hypothetical protein
MADTHQQTNNVTQPTHYQIRLGGHLGPAWSEWFDGMQITCTETGETLLTGPVADQAALHGLLHKLRDLGMPLISLNRLPASYSATLDGSSKQDIKE